MFRKRLIFAICFCLIIVNHAYSKDQPDYAEMKLLYSADDQICVPLTKTYNRLDHQHGAGRHFVLGWEDQFEGRFKSIGLMKPMVINGPDPDEVPSMDMPRVYYKLDLSSANRNRIVYVDNQCVGSCIDSSTSIWVFKPDARPTLKEYGEEPSKSNLFDPETVESEIAFQLDPAKKLHPSNSESVYPTIYGRFFDKIASEREKSLTLQERLERHEIFFTGGAGPFIQRVWQFKGNALFTAREPSVGVLVYRYDSPNTIDDVCYIASEAAITYQKLLSND